MPPSSRPPANSGSDVPAAATTIRCPIDEFVLVELVETVTQDAEKWVKGAAMDNTHTTITGSVERHDKDDANFKQYINLGKDTDGQPKRHPEYDREITLRARVKRKSGKTDALAGAMVKFTFQRTDGPRRPPNPAAPSPAVWDGADLKDDQREGFNKVNGDVTALAASDDRGWTSPVSFFLSAYGGDQFQIAAKLTDETPGGPGSAELKTKAKYVVWRKFWYQVTHATGYNPPKPTTAEKAYAQVFAEMTKANEKIFSKADLPADLQDRTFFKEYMLRTGGTNNVVATIGAHNKLDVAKFRTKETEYPLKAHLMVCDYQCDSEGASKINLIKLTANGTQVVLDPGAGGSIVCQPALKAGTKLVIVGEWSAVEKPWAKGGDITDADIEIDAARTTTLAVKVNLPAGAPIPTAKAPVWIRLQVETASGYLGESFGSGEILCVYRPWAVAGAQGSEIDYNDTVTHELGHMWKQTPKPTKQPDSMKDHPLQYVGHGGSGPHCRHGASGIAPGAKVDWHNATEKKPVPIQGNCVMYHSFSSKCSHEFCDTCKPYVQLQPMSSI